MDELMDGLMGEWKGWREREIKCLLSISYVLGTMLGAGN